MTAGRTPAAADLFAPVAADLAAVEACLVESAEGQHPLLAKALRYVFENRGKRLRPALVLLCGALGSYDLDRLVLLAASLEVVHTASLVHDDTIDEAITRRGLDTVNAVWDRHTAIVTGDFLFAKSAELAARMDDVRIMHMLSTTVMDMCAGEMRQHAMSGNWSVGVEEYLARIGAKTASLFAMCCAGAAVTVGLSERRISALSRFGYHAGLAFQIVDDVLDFEADERTLGKPAGSDLRHGTITLPSILYVRGLEPSDPLRQRLEHGEDTELALRLIQESGAPERAREHARLEMRKAASELDIFAPSTALDALRDIARYLPERTS